MHQTGSTYFACIHIFFTIFPILMLPIRKIKNITFYYMAGSTSAQSECQYERAYWLPQRGPRSYRPGFFVPLPEENLLFVICQILFWPSLFDHDGLHIGPAQNTKKNLAKMCNHINPMHAWKCCETGFHPEGKIPRRHPSSSRVYIGKYLQLKYAVGMQKESRFAWQGPQGIVR